MFAHPGSARTLMSSPVVPDLIYIEQGRAPGVRPGEPYGDVTLKKPPQLVKSVWRAAGESRWYRVDGHQ